MRVRAHPSCLRRCLQRLLLIVLLSLVTPTSASPYISFQALHPLAVATDSTSSLWLIDSMGALDSLRYGFSGIDYPVDLPIRRVSPSNTETANFTLAAFNSRFSYTAVPCALAVDRSDMLHVLAVTLRTDGSGITRVFIVTADSHGAIRGNFTVDASLCPSYRSTNMLSLAIAPSGHYHVVLSYQGYQQSGGCVLELNATGGAVRNVSMPAAPRTALPVAIALDSAGSLLVSDQANGVVWKMNNTGGLLGVFNFSTALQLTAVVVDAQGTVYALDAALSTVAVFSSSGALLRVLLNSTTGAQQAQDLKLTADGHNLLVCQQWWAVLKLDAATGAQLAQFDLSRPRFQSPQAIAVDAAGGVYVQDNRMQALVHLDRTGRTVATIPVPQGPTRDFLTEPIAVNREGTVLYTTNSLTRTLLRFHVPSSSWMQPWALAQEATYAGLAIGPLGDCLYISTRQGALRLNISTGQVLSFVNVTDLASTIVACVTVEQSGALLLCDLPNNRVVRLAANGSQLMVYSRPAMNWPNAVAVDSVGRLLVVDIMNNRVLMLSPTGVQLDVLMAADMPLLPWGVAVDGEGNVLVSDGELPRLVVFPRVAAPPASSSSSSSSARSSSPSSSLSSQLSLHSSSVSSSAAPSASSSPSTASLSSASSPSSSQLPTSSSADISSSSGSDDSSPSASYSMSTAALIALAVGSVLLVSVLTLVLLCWTRRWREQRKEQLSESLLAEQNGG